MHDERKSGQTCLDFFEDIEVQRLPALEFEGAVARADGAGEGVTARLLDELLSFTGICETGVAFLDFDVLLDAPEHAELGFDRNAYRVRRIHDALCDLDVLVKRIVRGVDHHGAEEAGFDALVAGLLVTMIEVDGVDRLRINLA